MFSYPVSLGKLFDFVDAIRRKFESSIRVPETPSGFLSARAMKR